MRSIQVRSIQVGDYVKVRRCSSSECYKVLAISHIYSQVKLQSLRYAHSVFWYPLDNVRLVDFYQPSLFSNSRINQGG